MYLVNSRRELIRTNTVVNPPNYDYQMNLDHTIYLTANNGPGSRFDPDFAIRDFFLD